MTEEPTRRTSRAADTEFAVLNILGEKWFSLWRNSAGLRMIVEFGGATILFVGFAAFFLDLENRKEDRAVRNAQLLAQIAELASIKDKDNARNAVRPIMQFLAENSIGMSGVAVRGVDLSNAVLRGAVLRDTDLRDANLTRADLRRADLSIADLRGTILRHAPLKDADLSGSNLRSADLRGANLEDTDLRRANLTLANFTGVDLMAAKLVGAFYCVGLAPVGLPEDVLSDLDTREC